jgi:hypothetical protein
MSAGVMGVLNRAPSAASARPVTRWTRTWRGMVITSGMGNFISGTGSGLAGVVAVAWLAGMPVRQSPSW